MCSFSGSWDRSTYSTSCRMSTRQSGKILVYILNYLIKNAWNAVFIRYMCIRAVWVKKWSSEPLMKVVSYYLKIISRTMSSKLVFLYYDFRCLEALQLGGPSARVLSPWELLGSYLVKKDQFWLHRSQNYCFILRNNFH